MFPPFANFEAQDTSFNNVEFNIYGGADLSALGYGMWAEDNWDPYQENFRYFNFTNISMTIFKSNVVPPTQQITGMFFRWALQTSYFS